MIDYKEIRHALHEHPQTAGNEQFAHDMIVRHLQGLHPDKVYTHVGGYGVIAVWGACSTPQSLRDSSPVSGEQPEEVMSDGCSPETGELPEGVKGGLDPQAPTIAFRADTDALPIGHRCGHDGHTTILLRLAELVDSGECGVDSTRVQMLPTHNILLLWQPAEETGTGSRAVIESGILQQYNIVRFYGLHNLPGYPLGTVVICPRTFAAASTGVVYRLDGRETHASTPELGINPGLAVAEIIQRISGLPRSGENFRQSTLICVHLGSPAFGTSAGHAEVMFTLRAFTNDEMERLLADANSTVDGIAASYGLAVSRSLVEPFRATENHGDCVGSIEKAAEEVPLRVHYQKEPFRWSEDFAEYLQCWPGAMFGIGSGEEQPELHHPDYVFPDALIEPAAQLFFRLAIL